MFQNVMSNTIDNKTKWLRIAIAAILLIVLTLTSSWNPLMAQEKMQKDESWVRVVPVDKVDVLYPKMKLVDLQYIHPVKEDQQPEAERFLNDIAIIEISTERARNFTGKALQQIADRKYYLVRGVLYNERTGGFWIYEVDDVLLVRHLSLGSAPREITKRAVVVALRAAPKDVYVSAGIAR